MSPEASQILNHLASMPTYGSDSCTAKVLSEIMIETGGDLLAWGSLWRIRSERLGGGIFRVSLKKAKLK